MELLPPKVVPTDCPAPSAWQMLIPSRHLQGYVVPTEFGWSTRHYGSVPSRKSTTPQGYFHAWTAVPMPRPPCLRHTTQLHPPPGQYYHPNPPESTRGYPPKPSPYYPPDIQHMLSQPQIPLL